MRSRAAAPEPAETPLVLVEKVHGALRIAAVNRSAAQGDLKPGMTLAEARTWLPQLRAEDSDRAADRRLLLELAAACERFTPLVALRGDDGLILDITGCAHLFGGENGLAGEVVRRFGRIGLSSRAAQAGTPDAAWAFARFAGTPATPGDEEALARTLPLAALGADPATVTALARAGFRTLGDLADRPAQLLAARFGNAPVDTLRRILGREDMRITPLRAPPALMAERHFAEPLGAMDALLAVLERLAGDICNGLMRRGEGGRAFEAWFFRSDGAVRQVTIETAQGGRDPAVLMRLFRLRIEALADPIDPGFGFDAVRLAATHSEVLADRQERLTDGGPAPEGADDVGDLVGRLVARFGRENVLRFVAQDTHDPARASRTVPWLSGTAATGWPEPEAGQPPTRPLTLFARPQPIEVLAEVPDAPPLRFRWRRVLHEVARAEGPERIAPEWWRDGDRLAETRDYYRVEDAAGRRFWIFRQGLYDGIGAPPRWFLHGLFA